MLYTINTSFQMLKKSLFTLAGLFACLFLSAQIGDVAPPVPGEKVDHGGIVINPLPHKVTVDNGATCPLGNGFSLNGDKKLFQLAGFLPTAVGGTSLTLKINTSKSYFTKQNIEPVSGAYRLEIAGNSVNVTGFDKAGVFYGLQTLRQVIEDGKGTDLPVMTVCDNPTLPLRGVIEGFYGPPWPHEVRLDLIDFMGRNKMNLYVYGPKDDPYHRTPSWREPYPSEEAAKIAELVKACKDNLVEFAWAIHPGGDIRWDAEDYSNILKKFDAMYALGVRSFAIFFDDIKGDGADAHKQAEWLTTLKKDLFKAHKDIAHLILCPTEYAKARSKPGEDGALAIFGKSLDPAYQIFWTGDQVMSHVTRSTLEYVGSRTRRPALFWWNFPVSDYILPHILQGPAYGFDTDLTSKDLSGLLTNPMEHGEASKLAIYSVADYTWNPSGYNPMDSWERALVELVPEDTEAYRLFAIHNCDAGKRFRRAESWETEVIDPDNYTPEQFNRLYDEFLRMETVPARMEKACPEMLLKELRPWLVQFGAQASRCRKAMDALRLSKGSDKAAFRQVLESARMNDEEKKAYEEHSTGTVVLQPFYEKLMEKLEGML